MFEAARYVANVEERVRFSLVALCGTIKVMTEDEIWEERHRKIQAAIERNKKNKKVSFKMVQEKGRTYFVPVLVKVP